VWRLELPLGGSHSSLSTAAARAGAVWLRPDNGRMPLSSRIMISLPSSVADRMGAGRPQHSTTAARAWAASARAWAASTPLAEAAVSPVAQAHPLPAQKTSCGTGGPGLGQSGGVKRARKRQISNITPVGRERRWIRATAAKSATCHSQGPP
jgi:hypothetical protein